MTLSLEIKVYFVVLCELWPMAELAIKCTVSVYRPAPRLRRWASFHMNHIMLDNNETCNQKNKLHTHFGAIQIQGARDWSS